MAFGIESTPDLNRYRLRVLKQVDKAVRKAMWKTISTNIISARQQAQVEFRKEVRVSAREMKSRFKIKKDFKKLRATMGVTNDGFPMIMFVKGRKQPRKQRGVKVKNRRPLKVEVKPGLVESRPDLFIVRKDGQSHVYRQNKDWQPGQEGSHKLFRQTVPPPSWLLLRQEPPRHRLVNHVKRKMQKDFQHQLKFFLGKLMRFKI